MCRHAPENSVEHSAISASRPVWRWRARQVARMAYRLLRGPVGLTYINSVFFTARRNECKRSVIKITINIYVAIQSVPLSVALIN